MIWVKNAENIGNFDFKYLIKIINMASFYNLGNVNKNYVLNLLIKENLYTFI